MGTKKKIEFEINKNGCFDCTSHKGDKDGYPRLMVNKKTYVMTRFIYKECFGEIPEGFVIRHKCDNPTCINPEHLEMGTHKDNTADMYKRNRQKHLSGSENPNAKLQEKDVEDIKNMMNNGNTIASIARKYNVSRKNIRKIREGETWGKAKGIKA